MNIRHNEALREQLASEYVLGTLKGGARRRFEFWLKNDVALRRSVAEWQDRLCPLAELSPAITPPPTVWRAIEKRIDADLSRHAAAMRPGWKDSIQFWRHLGLASSAAAVVLFAILLVRQPQVDMIAPSHVAILTDKAAQTTMIVTGDTKRRQLTVKVVTAQSLTANQSLELWALPKAGAPRSLGLIAANGAVTLSLPENVSPQSMPALAVSLEPKGGSPNPNAPSGPVLFTGAWVQI